MINKFLLNKQYRLSLLILLITIQAGIQWSDLLLGNTFFWWLIDFITLYTLLKIRKNSYKYGIIDLYLLWTIISTLRGIFIADNYWEWKQLIAGFLALSIPMFVYAFDKQNVTRIVLRYWFKYAFFFFLLFIPFLSEGAYHFYLGPVFVIGCFLPIIPRKWKFIIGLLLITMLWIDLGARSQVIKSAMVLLVSIGILFRKFISYKLIKITHWVCYISPVIFLFLGLSGTFNIFEGLASNEGDYVETKVVDGQVVEEDLSTDTRTFIYVEVIESALKHNYVLWGRTPARGNDSMTFGAYNAEILKTGKYERHGNELCHPNVFTWLGLIGVVLYSLIYLRSSYLAVYRSNNIYIKFLGCFIAFRWAFGWIEDTNGFNISNIALWMMIAMGLSKQFRLMDNQTFKRWIKTVFPF